MKKEIEDYPLILKPKHIAEILGVSLPTTYSIMAQAGFPLLPIGGRCKRTMRDDFFKWLSR